jgi:hypothetical protein
VRADRYPAGRFPWWLVAACTLIICVAATTVHYVAPPPAQPYAAPELYSPGVSQPTTPPAAPAHRSTRPAEPALAVIPPHVPAVDSTPLATVSAPSPTPAYPSVTGITIPALRINTGLVIKVGVEADGSMETPPLSKVQELGWYCPNAHTAQSGCGAPLPGDPGPATLVAHVDGDGKPGLFAHLSQLKAGDQVSVHRSDHKVAVFTVTDVAMADKSSFPAQQIFGDTGDPELRLITCGGPFDPAAHSYTQNVVVSAALSSLRPAS